MCQSLDTRSARKRKSTAAGIAALALAAALAVTPAAAETLRDALAAAYRYNPRLDAGRAALRATDEEIARANSGYRPRVAGSADFGVSRTEQASTAGTTTKTETNPRGYQVQATQPIFGGFQTLNRVRVAEATIRAARENLRTIEQSVLLEVVTAYTDTVRDLAIVKIRENNVEVLSRELRATRERFSVGEVTRTDVAQAEARRAAAVSALDLARANLKASRGSFERSVGRPPSNLAEPKPASNLPRSLDEAIAISSRENPVIISALYREQGARHTVDQIWGQLLPTVQLVGTHQRRFDTGAGIEQSETNSVVAQVSVPLYSNGDVEAQVRASKHTHVSRVQEIEQNRSEIQNQLVTSWSQLAAARAQLQSDNAQVSALSTALAGVREEEKVGQRTLLDILNAEQELLNAQVLLAQTKRNIVVTSYSVLSGIGRLSVQELKTVAEVYDPSVHYHEIRRKWFGVSITRADGRREHHDFGTAYDRDAGQGNAPIADRVHGTRPWTSNVSK